MVGISSNVDAPGCQAALSCPILERFVGSGAKEDGQTGPLFQKPFFKFVRRITQPDRLAEAFRKLRATPFIVEDFDDQGLDFMPALPRASSDCADQRRNSEEVFHFRESPVPFSDNYI